MLNFPDAPTSGATFTNGSLVWKWDGIKWGAGGLDVTYTLVAPTTGQTVLLTLGKTVLNPATPLAALTLQLPTAADTNVVHISTRQRIAALAITSNTAAIDWTTTELPQNGQLHFTYIASLNAWVRA